MLIIIKNNELPTRLQQVGVAPTERIIAMKILLFSKPDCNPCASVVAWFDANNTPYDKIDAYENPELAGKYMVRILPTIALVDDGGNILEHLTGYKPEQLEVVSRKVIG